MTTEPGSRPYSSSSALFPPSASLPAPRASLSGDSSVSSLYQSAIKIQPPPTGAGEMPPPSTIPKKRKVPDAPARVQYTAQSSASSSAVSGDGDADDDQDDREYDPTSAAKRSIAGAAAAATSKRTRAAPNAVAGPSSAAGSGRQPAAATDAPATAGKGRALSREQLRKANHSLIEKRRREKINAALQALRDMVPSLSGPDTSGKAGEFKLEVLERTVEHMRELKEYITQLESQIASSSSGQHSRRPVPSRPPVAPSSRDLKPSKPKKQRQSTSSPPTPSSSPDSATDDDEEHDEEDDGGYFGDRSYHRGPASNHAGRMRGGAVDDPDETEPEAFLPPAGAVAHGRRRSRSDRDSPSDSTTSTGSLLPPLSSQAAVPPFFTAGLAQASHESVTAHGQGHRPYAAHSAQQGSLSLTYPASLAAQAVPSTRPAAPPQAQNPTLYLPFPTPSPTSPFLTYSTTASSSSGPPEPSPFLAPLQNINMSLFGGAINLDQPVGGGGGGAGGAIGSGTDTPLLMGKRSYSDETRRSDGADATEGVEVTTTTTGGKARGKRDMAPEEVANLLLAISSPDTLRPSNGQTMLTPKMIPIGGPEDLASLAGSVARENLKRRSTLESEDFRLDAVSALQTIVVDDTRLPVTSASVHRAPQGKTASDILDL